MKVRSKTMNRRCMKKKMQKETDDLMAKRKKLRQQIALLKIQKSELVNEIQKEIVSEIRFKLNTFDNMYL